VIQGMKMATDVLQAVANYPVFADLAPNDVVDVNFIGHSRGAVVVSQALQDLETSIAVVDNPNYPEQLAHGFMMETLVDPHPANNDISHSSPDTEAEASSKEQLEQWLMYRGAQSIMQDPNVVIPSNVQAAVDIYQTNSYKDFTPPDYSSLLNLWGECPSQISNPDDLPIIDMHITDPVISHREIFWTLYASYVFDDQTLSVLGLEPFGGDPLVVTTQPPSTVTAGTPFGLVVTAENSDGSVNTSFNGSVTVADRDGNSLGGTLTVQVVNGVATFMGLTLTVAGYDDGLAVSSSRETGTTTSSIDVTAAAATQPAVSAPSGSVVCA
jgi:hypothetical protein